MKNLFALFLIFSFSSASCQEIKCYSGKVDLMSIKTVKADFEIHFSNKSKSDTLHLFINKNAQIENITLHSQSLPYSIEKVENDLPDIKEIIIVRKFPELFSLNIRYQYPLKEIKNKTFVYNPKWIELNNFTGWFPFNRENSSYKYELDIQIPSNYRLISPGSITKKSGHWFVKNNSISNDIPVVISDNVDIFQSDNKKVIFYTIGLNPGQRKEIHEDSNDILDFYKQKFNEPAKNGLIITINPFAHPWSYTRTGFISLSLKSNYKTDDRLRLAHEIGHLWWSNNKVYGNGNDWLNEAFAEYSSLIWFKQYASKETFNHLLEKYKRAYDLDLKITEVRPGDEHFVEVTYLKGAYLLYKLNLKVGNSTMMEVLKETNGKKVSKTVDFFNILQERIGSNATNEFEKQII